MHDERHLALIEADRRRLVRAATRLLGPAEAEDAVQDAYVRALEADALKLNAAQAWLLTVVRNLAIDRLRRRDWMQRWLEEAGRDDAASSAPSAEVDATLAEAAERALRVLASRLPASDGAALLLHEVFEASHAEIALASGKTEAGCRQQLRRALLRLRQLDIDGQKTAGRAEPEAMAETAFHLYAQALRDRAPQALFAMLRQPPTHARLAKAASARVTAAGPRAGCSLVQFGGQLGLALSLDGVTLCVLPLGAQGQRDDAEWPTVTAGR